MTLLNTNLNILVVDDEHFIRNLTCQALESMGFDNIAACESGFGALQTIAKGAPYDIIICDLQMPGMDGFEMLRRFKKANFDGSLIVSTGKGANIGDSAVDFAKAHKLDVLGALPKPVRKKRLKELLGRHEKNPVRNFSAQEEIAESELWEGLRSGEAGPLTAFYQPKVHLQTGQINGIETLARWNHAERGMLGPGTFIPLAEQGGHIDALTMLLSRIAIRQVKNWHDIGYELSVAINVSMCSLQNPKFGKFITQTASNIGLDPRYINIEVTESQYMDNQTECLEVLNRLRMSGFGLSIDDFGTGNSSMVQLKKIPFTELKIDREFVSGAGENSRALAILESSIDLASKMGMDIVAEGAETQSEWDLVAKLGCNYCQGFYSAKPMPASELEAFLKNWDKSEFKR